MLRRIGPLGRVYAFGAAWMGIVVMPVYTPFVVSRGLTPGDVLSLQSIYSVAVLLLDLPTGYLCDKIGRRRTILIGTTFNLFAWSLFAVAHGYTQFAILEVLLAGAWTLVTGSDIALIYDIFGQTGASAAQRERAITRYVSAQVISEALLGLLGSLLASWSLNAVGIATAVEAILPVLIALSFPTPAGHANIVTLNDLKSATRQLFRRPGLPLIFASRAIWGVATFVAVWLLQPYCSSQGISVKWFGLLWAGTLLTVSVTSEVARHIPRRRGQRGAMLILTGLPMIAYAGMAWFSGIPGIAAGYLFYVSRGLTSVRLLQALNQHIPSHLRATFNSLNTCAFRLCYIPIGFWLQPAVDRHGVPWPASVLAIGFFLVFLLLGLPLVRQAGTWRDEPLQPDGMDSTQRDELSRP